MIMTCDERLEKLLNKAGQTISDLPKPQTASYAYSRSDLREADTEATEWHGRLNSGAFDTADYILHLTDVIDRMETALENTLNLYDRNAHIVANTDMPEGVTREQFMAVVDAIHDSWEKYRAGLEPWEDWRADDV